MNRLQRLHDLTTQAQGVNADAQPLAYAAPRIARAVPGQLWTGQVGRANAVIRLPDAACWNGKLLIGGTPAVRNEYSLDWLLGDIALQRGYVFAACDKATPGLTLRDPARSITEWEPAYVGLTDAAQRLIGEVYGQPADRTYMAGVSNGGYVVRMMIERHAERFDGALEWEGALWHTQTRHLLTTLPVYVQDYPVFSNWRGDRTAAERARAFERLQDAGLAAHSQPAWDTYFMVYWVLSLWLYGRSLDPGWAPFAQDWSNEWLRDPTPIANYPWHERLDVLAQRIAPIANTGKLTKPLLSVAGNGDCLVPYAHNAVAYADLVAQQDASAWHRMYEIERGNHVDGMLRSGHFGQQPVQAYFEAALYHLEDWVERGIEPPPSGRYSVVEAFTHRGDDLLSARAEVDAQEL